MYKTIIINLKNILKNNCIILIVSGLLILILLINLNNITNLNMIKISFIFIFIILNVYLFYQEIIFENDKKNLYLKSGTENNIFKNIAKFSVLLTGLYSSLITIRDKDKSINEANEIINKMNKDNTRINELLNDNQKHLENNTIFKINFDDVFFTIKNLIEKFDHINSRLLLLKNSNDLNNNILNEINKLENDWEYYYENLKTDINKLKEIEQILNTKQSMFFNPEDIIKSFDLNEYQLIAVSLLLCNQIIISSLISIIFIFYGDYLIQKFNIETKYPRLYKFICLRRKFQKYYLFINIG